MKEWNPNSVVNGCVEPAKVYQPNFCTTTWFKNFAFQCGFCGKESVVFAFFGTPTCPFCKTKNIPRWETRI
jgi:aerobic-type carbon monoxide dehydrogenase small subunit (CoxS/CutS family)